ncbi:MAG: valine--tRNA ligase, partial [Candidatus Chloroheliales bacterium]
HAGIATQAAVEKELAKEGLSRHDLGREKFLERVWAWRKQYGNTILDQTRRLGASCDWNRLVFTLDPGPALAVRTAFKQLYDEGLIYRGERIVNWCPNDMTAISDLEVDYEERTDPLYYIKYGPIVLATVRPETKLGDTGLAVHPNDPRYRHMVGKDLDIPSVIGPISVLVVADEAVDMEFGTGAIKVTPAHDFTDFEIGQRHNLPFRQVIGKDGRMNENAHQYAGLTVEEARERIVDDMQKLGLIDHINRNYIHKVGVCSRCGTVIEPLISEQWFVKMKPLAEPAIAAVRDGRTEIVPQRFDKIYFNWLENIRDWCISRQLWWGHRIPVWYCDGCGGQTVSVGDPTACEQCGSASIHQDPDVLDTWFSSGLWPISTLGWPQQTPDLAYFYPTSVMETGYDILFFWVARMMMLCLHFTDQVPFKTVYLHGMIRDAIGRKMSKSLGNGVDPLELIDKYGSDALRFGLLTGSTPGNDIKYSAELAEKGQRFANKLWNATRFMLMLASEDAAPPVAPTLADRWITSRYNALLAEVNRLLEAYQFGVAGRFIYEFLWNEFCDWYIEMLKLPGRASTATARSILDATLRLLHPYMPFVTEELWQHLNGFPANDETLPKDKRSIIVAPWPTTIGERDEAAEHDITLLIEAITAIRNARSEAKAEPSRKIAARITAHTNAAATTFTAERDVLIRLANLDPAQLEIVDANNSPLPPGGEEPSVSVNNAPLPTGGEGLGERASEGISIALNEADIFLPLAGLVDMEAERKRIAAEIAEAERDIQNAERLLANDNFTARAKPEVVQKERDKLAAARDRLARLTSRAASDK